MLLLLSCASVFQNGQTSPPRDTGTIQGRGGGAIEASGTTGKVIISVSLLQKISWPGLIVFFCKGLSTVKYYVDFLQITFSLVFLNVIALYLIYNSSCLSFSFIE